MTLQLQESKPAVAETPDPIVNNNQTATSRLRLPLGDINVVVVTDVHSWIAGHERHEPLLMDVDYGDVLSFYQHLQNLTSEMSSTRSNQQYLLSSKQHLPHYHDLFFVMNGDFVDGTGLSAVPPAHLTRLLAYMPWNAVNIGNHELYHNETVQFLNDSGFIQHWNGTYLTSNVVWAQTHKPIGNRYTILRGRNYRVLTFGFLYNFPNYCSLTRVEFVQDAVQSEWFIAALHNEQYDAILVLAHMDCDDPLVHFLLASIRDKIRHRPHMSIQFVTGHSHRRCFLALDKASTSFEAGRYLDTIGFVSFPSEQQIAGMNHNTQNLSNINDDDNDSDASDPLTLFHHTFLDARKQVLENALGFDSNGNDGNNNDSTFATPEGAQLSNLIRETQQALELDTVIGCSPITLELTNADLSSSNSLWGWFAKSVVPTQLFLPAALDNPLVNTKMITRKGKSRYRSIQNVGGRSHEVYVQRTGAFRYSLIQGTVSIDDVIAVSPFNDTIYQVNERIRGSQLIHILREAEQTVTGGKPHPDLPNIVVTPSRLQHKMYYTVYSPDWNMPEVLERITNWTGQIVSPIAVVPRITTTTLWRDYIHEHWGSCDKATMMMTQLHDTKSLHLSGVDVLGHVPPNTQSALLAGFAILLLAGWMVRMNRKVVRYDNSGESQPLLRNTTTIKNSFQRNECAH